jgi:dihydroorotate dehydrogenase (NAD+) catalytic subunit
MNSAMTQPSIQVSVGNVTLDSPAMLASGTLGEFPEILTCALQKGAGAVVTRTIREAVDPSRSRTPIPRYFICNGTMLNCEWGNNRPWVYWWSEGVDEVSRHGPLVLSMSGRDIAGVAHLIQKFEEKDIVAYELNISCPHSNTLFGQVNEDCEHLCRLLKAAKRVTSRPIWIKLGWSSYLNQMARVSEEYGANAVVATNSFGPGLAIDVETGIPRLGIVGGLGGVSGSAIRPLSLGVVFELVQTLSIPVIGCGGISSTSDVLESLMAGASAVQLYTAAFLNGLDVFHQINTGLIDYLLRKGLHSIDDIHGVAQDKANVNSFGRVIPSIDASHCTGCGRCLEVCLWNALPSKMPGDIDKNLCIGCNACAYVCPVGCIEPCCREDALFHSAIS